MLTRLYVDNYKALVNFELKLDGHALLMGANGCGKSTVLEVIRALVRFVARGADVEGSFGDASTATTRWQSRDTVRVEVELAAGRQCFVYKLTLEASPYFWAVMSEELSVDGHALLQRPTHDMATVVGAAGKSDRVVVADASRSLVHALAQYREDDFDSFVKALERLVTVRPDPRAMSVRSEKETSTLAYDLANFASWWRHLVQEQPDAAQEAVAAIAQTLPGFRNMAIQRRESDEFRVLRTSWTLTGETKPVEFTFDELSDGQRVLIAYHAIAASLAATGGTLLIDEPDNFIALAELQPLIRTILDKEAVQLIVASHHPEVLNALAVEYGYRLWRDGNGPVRVERFAAPDDTLLTPAEIVAARMDAHDG